MKFKAGDIVRLESDFAGTYLRIIHDGLLVEMNIVSFGPGESGRDAKVASVEDAA